MVVCPTHTDFPDCHPLLTSNVWADFEKTFIQCIVYNYEALKEYKDEASLKGAGKVMTKGKEYVVEVCLPESRC